MVVLLVKVLLVNKVCFVWWGVEEVGLVGLIYYVQNFVLEEKKKIKVYLNFDMIGLLNFGNFIYDGDGFDFGFQGLFGLVVIECLFEVYFCLCGQ